MKQTKRRLFRLALWLEKAYARRARADRLEALASFRLGLPHHFEHVRRQAELLGLATERGWARAALDLRARYQGALYGLSQAVQQLSAACREDRPAPPSPIELFNELVAACDDFGDVLDRDGTLSVLTDPVRLDGIYLGAFRIVLDPDCFEHCDTERWYRVVAEDPHTAQPDQEVTHPHVSGGRLCAGEASTAIRASLLQGRLSEFFLLVRSVLETYNPSSAYVRLEAWDGVACADCGDYVSEGELCFCPFCELDHCDRCTRACMDCGSYGCRNCLIRSDLSRQWVCPDCRTDCEGCDKVAASSELNDQCLCAACVQANEPEKENDDDDQSDTQTDPHASGESAVSPAA